MVQSFPRTYIGGSFVHQATLYSLLIYHLINCLQNQKIRLRDLSIFHFSILIFCTINVYLQAATLEPNNMSIRYAIASHRIKDAVRSQGSREQLTWAANEMASILKEGDADLPVAWAGLAMAYKAQHEIAAAFYSEQTDLDEADELALCTLKRVMLAI